ncbi:MAG TPA: tRNA (guanosine(46)-N7)-methyltransferase TrmB [Gammaproteobacteria bacterium]|nr:tRNA (guanosine(46)-N7)-methyltransferase TrmB [Gammaproteobacteria bacterium]
MNTPDTTPHPRRIRSFVRREGRLTPAQARALDALLPRYGLNIENGVFDFPQLFGRDAPRTLEIGFGNGDTLAELAQRHPEQDFIGIEVHRPGVGRLLNAAAAAGLGNLRVVCADAVEVLSTCVPDASLDAVLLYFPDPWPKKRHHKRRIVQPEFAELVARKLVRGGHFRLATDWPEYAEHMLAVLSACPALENRAGAAGHVPRPAERPLTRFERRGLMRGHPVRDLAFVRR